jgi:ubiquinone/menaquinone biosynthesis C-methylase UbiE
MKLSSKYIYQNNFSKKNNSVLNSNIRIQKSKKIFAVLKNYLGKEIKNLNQMTCLDIGGSAGFTAKLMSPYVKKFYVIDIDENALKFGIKNNYSDNIAYEPGDAMNLHFKDSSVDIIVCNMVYEHVPDPQRMMSEIYRVLKTNGICYMGASNKYIIIEPHYKLPFLAWLPKWMSNIYLKLMNKGSVYYENLLSYRDLKKLFCDFIIRDYTADVINNSDKFFATDTVKKNSLFSKIPPSILRFIEPIIPGYIFILKK